MIRAIQHNSASLYKWTIVALETWVEPTADVVCLQQPQREMGGVEISYHVYKIRKRERVCTVIRMGGGLVVDERKDGSWGANNNVMDTDIRRRGEKITMIVNSYDQRDTESGEKQVRNSNRQRVIRHGRTVLAGDFDSLTSVGPKVPSAAKRHRVGRSD